MVHLEGLHTEVKVECRQRKYQDLGHAFITVHK